MNLQNLLKEVNLNMTVRIKSCHEMRRVLRKPAFCICENKDTDQLHCNCEADQRLRFRYIDTLFFLNTKFQASSHLLWLYSQVCVGPRRKHRRPVFSQQGSNLLLCLVYFILCCYMKSLPKKFFLLFIDDCIGSWVKDPIY